VKKLNLTNFLFWGYHPKSMKIENPPSSPSVKGGITTPPFSKGRLGGIFFLTNIKGISVIFLVIAMLLMVTIGYVFSYLIPTKQKSVVFPIQSTQAFFLAQSGVEFAVRYAKDQGWTTKAQLAGLTGMTKTFGAGSFTLTYTNTAPNLDTLTSVGQVPAGTERRRIVVSNLTSFLNYFAYHKSITVQAGQVSAGPLTNFPMLVSVTDPNLETVANAGHVASYNAGTNDPWDIIFEGLDDTTCGGAGTSPCKLNHEIELYNQATGQLIAWVKVPSINNGTVIYMYYGNSCMTASSQNATGVWDANYKGVWHLKEATGTNLADSTSNGNTATPYNSPTQVGGEIDGSLQFDGTTNYIQASNSPSLQIGSALTVSAWIYPLSVPSGSHRIISKWTPSNQEYILYLSGTEIGVGIETSFAVTTNANLAINTWYHLEMVWSGSNVALYKNGVLFQNMAVTTATTGTSSPVVFAKHGSTSTEYFNGKIDEGRVSNSARSANWIATEYSNQSNPGNIGTPGFYAVGAEQNN
jgi:hypothetical protein